MWRIISFKPHSTNVHEANKHLIKAIWDADRLFIPKGNHNSTNHTHLPMHICKFIHHCNHIRNQIITLNNHINKQIHKHKTNTWKQQKHNSHSLWGTIAQLSNKKQPTQQNRSISFRTKTAITDIDKAKAFNKQFTNITP